MKKSTVLKVVSKELNVAHKLGYHHKRFIGRGLLAVAYANKHIKDVFDAVKEVLEDVEALRGAWCNLEDWLVCEAHVPKELITCNNMYEYRQRFIKHLIKQYKAKGA